MAFAWINYLELAEYLASGDSEGPFTEEAGKRSAISRAYYAAFCHARNYASSHWGFIPLKTAEDHDKVATLFLNQDDEVISNIGSDLQTLRSWRNKCDYDDTWNGFPMSVAPAINASSQVFDVLT